MTLSHVDKIPGRLEFEVQGWFGVDRLRAKGTEDMVGSDALGDLAWNHGLGVVFVVAYNFGLSAQVLRNVCPAIDGWLLDRVRSRLGC